MNLKFIVGFKLDGKPSSSGRIAEIFIPRMGSSKRSNKDEVFLQTCAAIAEVCEKCLFYKDVQVMASFLERPMRIKYLIRFPNDSCAVLEAVTNSLDLRKKAKELKDHFEIAVQNNYTKLKFVFPILLTTDIKEGFEEIEKEYGIMVLQSTNAINVFKQIMANGQPS